MSSELENDPQKPQKAQTPASTDSLPSFTKKLQTVVLDTTKQTINALEQTIVLLEQKSSQTESESQVIRLHRLELLKLYSHEINKLAQLSETSRRSCDLAKQLLEISCEEKRTYLKKLQRTDVHSPHLTQITAKLAELDLNITSQKAFLAMQQNEYREIRSEQLLDRQARTKLLKELDFVKSSTSALLEVMKAPEKMPSLDKPQPLSTAQHPSTFRLNGTSLPLSEMKPTPTDPADPHLNPPKP